MPRPGRFRFPRLRAALLAGLLALAAAAAAPRPSRAATVDELTKILLEDSSYKVRLQAALVLGRLGDRAAVGPLGKALADENRAVRAMAAQSLGRLGAPEGAGALKALLQREKDPFVRKEAQKALASLGPERSDGAARRPKLYLHFGSFSGGTRSANPPMLQMLVAALKRELGKLPSVTFEADGAGGDKTGKPGGGGFLIDGNVTRLEDGVVGGTVEINCDVKVMVARWPSKSIILWTNAGAAVQGGSRDRDKENARRDCLEASAGQLAEDLAKFFRTQGG